MYIRNGNFAWECVQVESCFQEFAKKSFDASFASTPHIFIFEASFFKFLFYFVNFLLICLQLMLLVFMFSLRLRSTEEDLLFLFYAIH